MSNRIATLMSLPLSAEAQSIVAQDYYSSITLGVSLEIRIEKDVGFDVELLKNIILYGWGEGIEKEIKIVDVRGNIFSGENALGVVRSDVHKGKSLFSLYVMEDDDFEYCYLCVHHSLADERTLQLIEKYIKTAHDKKSEGIFPLLKGREDYLKYVKNQKTCAKRYVREVETLDDDLKPVKISPESSLTWDSSEKRAHLNCTIRIEQYTKVELINDFLEFLLDRNEIVGSGNIVCSSKRWDEQFPEAIGMMTGLIPIRAGKSNKQIIAKPALSWEMCAKFCKTSKKIIDVCRSSELFINGAEKRTVVSSQLENARFPVGLEITESNTRHEFFVEIEGQFCDERMVGCLLNNFKRTLGKKLTVLER